MNYLSLEDFKKLSEEEQRIRYKEMSSHDKFIYRITCYVPCETIGYMEVTQEDKDRAQAMYEWGKALENKRGE